LAVVVLRSPSLEVVTGAPAVTKNQRRLHRSVLLVLLLPYAAVVRSYCSIPAKVSEYQKVSEKGKQDSEKGKQDSVNKLVQSLLIIIIQ
jgi:hypothetical protein